MATTINIHEAKTHLSRLVDEVAAGAEIIIAKAGRPMRIRRTVRMRMLLDAQSSETS